MRLQGKVAVVTGGAQGIGRAIALGLGREGAKIVVADLQADKAKNVVDELQALGTEGSSRGGERCQRVLRETVGERHIRPLW